MHCFIVFDEFYLIKKLNSYLKNHRSSHAKQIKVENPPNRITKTTERINKNPEKQTHTAFQLLLLIQSPPPITSLPIKMILYSKSSTSRIPPIFSTKKIEQKKSFFVNIYQNKCMSNLYMQLCEMFIRPMRQTYNRHDLGHSARGEEVRRIDFEIYNHNEQKLCCSFYRNLQVPHTPCVVYLHGFNGSRLESLPYVQQVLSLGFSMCAFDFAGTGNSEGDYVSLGHHQQYDIQSVIKNVHEKFKVQRFALWGRSMGAVAAIKFYSLLEQMKWEQKEKTAFQISIGCMVLDSPFQSLSELAIEIAHQKVRIPQLLIKAVFMMIQSTIQTKANFKFDDLQLHSHVLKIRCPVLLLASKEDKLIDVRHSEKIYETIPHKFKEILFIKGQHNDQREKKTISDVIDFLKKKMKMERNQRHFSCLSTYRKLQTYQSTKCFKAHEDFSREIQNQNQRPRIKYSPQTPQSLTPDTSLMLRHTRTQTEKLPQKMQAFLSSDQTKIKTSKQIPLSGNATPSSKYSPNYMTPDHIEEVCSHQKGQSFFTSKVLKNEQVSDIQHKNIISEKLRKKGTIKRKNQNINKISPTIPRTQIQKLSKKRQKQPVTSSKICNQITSKQSIKLALQKKLFNSPKKKSDIKKDYSYSEKVLKLI